MTKTALITGGNRGIGRSAALHLDADVVVTYRSHAEEANAVVAEVEAQGRKAAALQLDVADTGSFPTFAERLRELLHGWDRDDLDFLVNNAGENRTAPFAEFTEADFDFLVDVHFKGVFFLTQTLTGLLADGGAVINLSTGLTQHVGPDRSVYASVKGAVEVLTRYLAVELGKRGITVNTVAPGAVATDFSGGVLRATPALQEAIAAGTALGRIADADDIGPAIAALLGDGTRWISGERIAVSGGAAL
jgi:NAD(P)-dependent dehydrogenase (short-subunit alcohol dehydrogenase family)